MTIAVGGAPSPASRRRSSKTRGPRPASTSRRVSPEAKRAVFPSLPLARTRIFISRRGLCVRHGLTRGVLLGVAHRDLELFIDFLLDVLLAGGRRRLEPKAAPLVGRVGAPAHHELVAVQFALVRA